MPAPTICLGRSGTSEGHTSSESRTVHGSPRTNSFAASHVTSCQRLPVIAVKAYDACEEPGMLKCLLVGLCVLMSLCACATTGGASDTAKSAVAGATPRQPLCASPDGSTRVSPSARNCTAPGSVYTRPQIDRTGQAD